MTATSTLVPLARAGDIFEPGEQPSYDCLLSWIHKGYRVNGQRIRLRALREGRRWMISEEILNRFRAECAVASLPPEEPPATVRRRPGGRERRRVSAAAAADTAALRADGWMS